MVVFFLCIIYPIYYLKYIIFFKIATLAWNECKAKLSFSSDSQITHHLDFLVSAGWGLFQAFLLPAWFTRRHVMRFTWPANRIWRGGGGQWQDFQQPVIHYIEIPFKKSVPASGEIDVKFAWRMWIKEHCQLKLHTSK